jgi:undecaprenyl phosphate-alpha-L-ara4N flippase subunit ArnE
VGNLSWFQIGGLMAVTSSLAAGQILFKYASQRLEVDQGLWPFLLSFVSWPFVSAVCLYALSTILWTVVLIKIPLSAAYPFVAFAFALVPIAATVFLGESLSPRYWVGVSLLVAGVILITYSDVH